MITFTKTGNSIERVIKKYYPAYNHLSNSEKSLLINYSIQYMFKGVSASKYTSLVRSLLDNDKYRVIEMRRTFSSKGYFIKNLKLWLYYWYINKPKIEVFKSFGLKDNDINLHTKLDATTLKMFARLDKLGLKAKTVKEFDEAIEHVINSSKCRLFIRKMVYRKMRFIFEPHGMDPEDICKQLTADGIQAAMFTYPNITSMEHLCNIVTRTAHNDGMNFIDKYTTKSRGRIRANSDVKFDSRVIVPLHSPEVTEYLGQLENAVKEDDVLTTRISVKRVLRKYNKKQRYFITLASGEYDRQFSTWLKTENKSKKDNDTLFERISFTRYIKLALQYLEVPEKAGLKLLDELRDKLSAHKQAA